MVEQLDEIALQFLTSKNIGATTATPQQISDAQAYSSCYTWYLTKQQVLPNTADLAASIFVQKYALHDANGMCLEKTPEDMWNRIATVLAQEELDTNPHTTKSFEDWFIIFREALDNWKYSPQGSGLYSLGNPYVKASASNCFLTTSPKDSLESIFDTAKMMARIFLFMSGSRQSSLRLSPGKVDQPG